MVKFVLSESAADTSEEEEADICTNFAKRRAVGNKSDKVPSCTFI